MWRYALDFFDARAAMYDGGAEGVNTIATGITN
jgi:hypothetical protein